jgi:hypothetical protein
MLEEDCAQEFKFDPIAFRCDFNEYKNFKELKNDYDVENMEELEGKTSVITIPNSERLIIQAY